MPSLRFIAMPTDQARAFQCGALDANGQLPERHLSDGDGIPCRHCQTNVGAGEPYLVLAYRPFPRPQPYAETGPIFLHAGPCLRYPETSAPPAIFIDKPRRFLVKGYGTDDRIAYEDCEIVAETDLVIAASRLLGKSEVSYLHVRSALFNCYQWRIERAAGSLID